MATGDSSLRSDPLADPIMEMGCGIFKAAVVCQAVELGIFDQIESMNNSVTARSVANKHGYKPEVTELLLDALVCYELLNKTPNKEAAEYSNTKSTQKYLLKTVEPNLTHNLLANRLMSHAILKLNSLLKKGTNDTCYEGLLNELDFSNLQLDKKVIKTDQNQNPLKEKTEINARAFMVQMDSCMCPVVHAITVAFDVAGHKTLLDLGGSSGYLAYEFVETYPQLNAIVLDRPETIQIAQELQPEHTKTKVEFVEGDFFDDKLFPEADLMVLSHIVHNWGEDKLDILLKKAYNSLSPGGSLLVVEKMLNEDKTGPDPAIFLNMVMATVCNGRERTFVEYDKLLSRYGFQKIEGKIISGQNCFDVILARKPLL